MRVVVAEDHALLRDGLTRLLTAYGVEVALALDGTDGLAAALAREDIDAAILDVRLPPTFTDEGLRAAIAARAARPGFPVMVLSQYVEHLYARELLASGDGGIAGALFVSEKAVAKHINGIFTKLDLPVAGDDHRRVLAVLAWLKV